MAGDNDRAGDATILRVLAELREELVDQKHKD